MNLLLFLLIPLITAAAVLLCTAAYQVRWVALAGSLVQWVLAIVLVAQLSGSSTAGHWMLEQQYALYPSLGIQLHLGVDGVAVAMIALTAFVVLAGVLVSWKVEKMTKEFYFLLLLLSLGAYGFFISLNWFMMFFFLEIAVIPKYLLIGIWGSGRKEYSANKLALMLMAGSALVIVGLMGTYYATGGSAGFDLPLLMQAKLTDQTQRVFFPFLFIGFGIFTALFPFHTWVPDGHSSAPTAGSMFLAGISMKLGGYGCLRVATLMMPEAAQHYSPYIILLAVIAIVYGAFATLMQKDLKYMNAYSSVSHCGFVLLGIGMLTKTALNGAVLQMVSHGLMTALFFAVIGMLYERTHTRTITEMGGLMKVMPFATTILFIAGLCSLGLPGLSGFVAEMTVFMGSWEHVDTFRRAATVLSCLSIVVTAVYILRAIGQVAMGPIQPQYARLKDADWNEKLAAGVLVAGIVIMGVMPGWISRMTGF